MTDMVDVPIGANPPWAERVRRMAFWAGLSATSAAVAVAVLSDGAPGWASVALLAGAGAGALLLLYGLVANEAFARLAPKADPNTADARAADSAAAAFDAMTEPALIVDANGAPRLANRAYRELARSLGVTRETQRPPGFDRLLGVHPIVTQTLYTLARAAKAGEHGQARLPATPIAAGGRPRALDLEVSPLPWGESLWVARPHATETEEEETPSEPLLDEAPVGFFSSAPDGRVLFMNQTLKDWLGDRADGEAMRVADFLGDDAWRVLERGGSDRVRRAEVRLKARDGIDTRAIVVTRWTKDGARPSSRSVVFGLTGSFAPPAVTQVAAASGGATRKSMLDAMFNNAPFGVARLDGAAPADAMIEDANPALQQLTDGRAAPGSRFADLFVFDDPDMRARLDSASASSGAPVDLILPPSEADPNRPREVHVFFAPDRTDRAAAFLVDVSQYKDIERQFHRIQRIQSIGLLAGEMAHSVRNVLQKIQFVCDELTTKHPVGDSSYPLVQTINMNVNMCGALMRELMAFSRREIIRPEPIELAALFAEIFELIKLALPEKIELQVRHDRNLPIVKADVGQFQNIMVNLVNNARDAIHERGGPGVITIETSRADASELRARHMPDIEADDFAVIKVSDDGCGMSREVLDHVFEPFYTTKGEKRGTGLGLSTVYGVVSQAGGHVLVDSEVGVGTTFSVYLPAYDADPAEREAIAARAKQRTQKRVDLAGRGRILLVEDEDELRRPAAMSLERSGYEVVDAPDGTDALEILQNDERGFDLMISDVSMLEMDGPELLEAASEELKNTRIIFMSGYAEPDFSDTLAREHAIAYLGKPFPTSALLEAVKKQIGEAGGGDEEG